MREELNQKIENEYLEYKNSFLNATKEEIFESADEIDFVTKLYDFVIENEELTDNQVEKLLSLNNILDALYSACLDDDGVWEINDSLNECLIKIVDELYS